MNRQKLKKIYYIPGIISLTVLPILFILFADREIRANSYGVLRLTLADINLPKKFPELFKDFGGSYPPKRNYTDIVLTGNISTDRTKLNFAQIRIREILNSNDSINGLHFQFGDSSQYWAFVKTVDILRIEGAKTYMPLDDNLWFYHFPPDTSIIYWTCGTTYEPISFKESWWTECWQQAKLVWNTSWHVILLFISFLFFIFILRQTNNSR